MMGDFNEILSGEDKFGGSRLTLTEPWNSKIVLMLVTSLTWDSRDLNTLGPIFGKFQISYLRGLTNVLQTPHGEFFFRKHL